MTLKPFMNTSTDSVAIYTSKAISARARLDPTIANLAFGEPEFGPPENLAASIRDTHLTYGAFTDAVKGYEQPRGLRELRNAISQWYRRRYNYWVDPETEILITHGAVEAIALAILCTSNPGDTILLTNPTYMLYTNSIKTLARVDVRLTRTHDSEYLGMLDAIKGGTGTRTIGARALIINSPENPSGYVVGAEEWRALSTFAEKRNLWVIHDEVYDTMTFTRPHFPARCIDALNNRAILVNSFSKKFGTPGLRIGWLCAKPELISLAAKLHDYLYLAVNVLFEHIALTLIKDGVSDIWLEKQTTVLRHRAETVVKSLAPETGFSWDRRPLGGMFAFPNITGFSRAIPRYYLEKHCNLGDSVADYLMEERKVAVTPGSIYGSQGNECVRLVLCSGEATLHDALDRLKAAAR